MQIAYLYLNRSRDLKRSLGFTYIGLMLIVAIAGIALSGVGIVWKTEMQRENEKELRFVGEQYVAAIASYYECKVCGPQQLPKNLKDLLKDSRAPSVVRHIRKLYRDPMTRSNDWGLIKSGDRITGVYSKSTLEPLAKPYNPDSLNKKKDATKSGSSVTGNSANTGQLNVNQASASQSSGVDSNNIINGQSVVSIDKSDTNKTAQPMKPKKPSYQDWQFVYGGATGQTPNTTNSNLMNNSNDTVITSAPSTTQSDADLWVAGQGDRTKELCTEPYLAAQKACLELCASKVSSNDCRSCKADAQSAYSLCSKSVQ